MQRGGGGEFDQRREKKDTNSEISRRLRAYVVTDVWIWDAHVILCNPQPPACTSATLDWEAGELVSKLCTLDPQRSLKVPNKLNIRYYVDIMLDVN